MTGERAYEIYDPETVDRRTALLAAPDPRDILDELDVHLVAVPLDLSYAILCQKLLVGADSSWAYVYCDQRTAVLADTGYAETRRLVEGAVAGTLLYPDQATAALSRAMCLASPASGAPGQVTVTALERAVSLRPADFAYALLYHRARMGGVDKKSLIRYLEDQDTILGKMDADSADGIQVLRSRLNVTTYLRRLYDMKTQKDEWDAVQELNSRISNRIDALENAPWAKGLLKRLQAT